MQEVAKSAPPPTTDIEDEDDDDDEAKFQADLQRALEVSKSEDSRNAHHHRGASSQSNQTTVSPFLSERAHLERARIERQKRLRGDAGLDDDKDVEVAQPPAKRQHFSPLPRVHTDGRTNAVSSSSHSATPATRAVPNIRTIDQVFWDGELRQTGNQHADPRKDGKPTFRLTEILGKVCRYGTHR